jgi:hypothetical protein
MLSSLMSSHRPMSMRWISEVPSKIVKLLGVLGLSGEYTDDHVADRAISR